MVHPTKIVLAFGLALGTWQTFVAAWPPGSHCKDLTHNNDNGTLRELTFPQHQSTKELTARDDKDKCVFDRGRLYTKDGYPCLVSPELKDLSGCRPAPVTKYADAQKEQIRDSVLSFCIETVSYLRNESRPLEPLSQVYNYTKKKVANVYWLNITEDTHCEPQQQYLDLLQPDTNPLTASGSSDPYDCLSIMWASWKECRDNKGRGGWIQSGCLNYSLTPHPEMDH